MVGRYGLRCIYEIATLTTLWDTHPWIVFAGHHRLSFFGHKFRGGGCALLECIIQEKVHGEQLRHAVTALQDGWVELWMCSCVYHLIKINSKSNFTIWLMNWTEMLCRWNMSMVIAAKHCHVLRESWLERITILARWHGRSTIHAPTGQSGEDGWVSTGQGPQGRTARGGKGLKTTREVWGLNCS